MMIQKFKDYQQLLTENEELKIKLSIITQFQDKYEKTISIISQNNSQQIEQVQKHLSSTTEQITIYEEKFQMMQKELVEQFNQIVMQKEQIALQMEKMKEKESEIFQKDQFIMNSLKQHLNSNKNQPKPFQIQSQYRVKNLKKRMKELQTRNRYLENLLISQSDGNKILDHFKQRCSELQKENDELLCRKQLQNDQ